MTTPPTKDCPECGGSGKNNFNLDNICHDCHGTGVVAAEAEPPILDFQGWTWDAENREWVAPTAPTPPAATDDEVMAILDDFITEATLDGSPNTGVKYPTSEEARAAIEAHYAARPKKLLADSYNVTRDTDFARGYREALIQVINGEQAGGGK